MLPVACICVVVSLPRQDLLQYTGSLQRLRSIVKVACLWQVAHFGGADEVRAIVSSLAEGESD